MLPGAFSRTEGSILLERELSEAPLQKLRATWETGYIQRRCVQFAKMGMPALIRCKQVAVPWRVALGCGWSAGETAALPELSAARQSTALPNPATLESALAANGG